MRNLLYVGLGVLFFNPVNSQTLNDLNFLTLSSLNGSARYKSMAGAFGALMTGVFANPLINEGNAGLLYGNPGQVWIQFQSIIAVSLYSAIVTFIIYKVISLIFGTGRITEEVEKDGMDMAYHGERGFDISD